MTEKQKQYRRENTKRVVINLTLSDYTRWKAVAELTGKPLATMIRNMVENHIADIEFTEEHDIRELLAYQQSLKEDIT